MLLSTSYIAIDREVDVTVVGGGLQAQQQLTFHLDRLNKQREEKQMTAALAMSMEDDDDDGDGDLYDKTGSSGADKDKDKDKVMDKDHNPWGDSGAKPTEK